MNHSFERTDDATLDRLVDGELSSDQRRRVLAALDEQPDGWRRCALAFVEAQALGGAMKEMMHAAPDRSESAAVLPLERNTANRPWYLMPAWQRGMMWLAVAASLAVAFGLGQQFDGIGDSASPRVDIAASSPAVPAIQGAGAPNADAVTLVVNDSQGRPQRIEVPLVEGRRLGQFFADSPAWVNSPQLKKQLDAQGLDMAARRRYAPMFFEQQNRLSPMIVPVDDVIVRPVNRPVY